jgi:hypothetical protein
VLRPKAGTFDSVDTLNPDFIRYDDIDSCSFPAAIRHSLTPAIGALVAVATRPEGPYRVNTRLRAILQRRHRDSPRPDLSRRERGGSIRTASPFKARCTPRALHRLAP